MSDGGLSTLRRAGRIASIEVSEILRIGEVARQRRRNGHPVIVLAAGEPDFDTPEHVKAAASRAIEQGQTKYTALDGNPELKEAIAGKFLRENGLRYGPAEIIAGAGAKQLIANAMLATLDRGDEVLLPLPYWTSYADIVQLADGSPRPLPTSQADGFRLRPDVLDRAITPRTRWLFLNSPANPSGHAYDRQTMAALTEVLHRHPHVWLLADDIYEHLLYDGAEFVTPAQVDPRIKDRTLTINGVSKSHAMTGWRLGYAGGPASLVAAMAVVQSQTTSNPSSISQAAAIAALTGPQDHLAVRRESFRRRRDIVVERLDAIPGIECRRPEGAFYAFAGCADLIGRRTPKGLLIDGDVAFCRHLLEEHDVAVIPGTCFGLGPFFRLSYASSMKDLVEGCDRIATAVSALS